MINHYYTLAGVVRSAKRLVGCKLIECFSQDKDEIVLAFIDGNNDLLHLCINLSSTNYCLTVRDRFSRARNNSKDLFPQILGETLQDIYIEDNNRVITLKFIVLSAVVELFGAGRNNLIFLNSKGKIYAARSNEKELIGEKYIYPLSNIRKAEKDNFATIGELLTRSDILLPKVYAGEILRHYNLKYDTPIGEISDVDSIISDAYLMRQDAIHSCKFYLYTDSDSALLTHLPVDSFAGGDPRIYDDLNKAVCVRFGYTCRLAELDTQKRQSRKKLQLLVKRAESALKMCENAGSLAPKIAEYTLFADLLLSQPPTKEKFGSSISLDDWSGNSISIPLKPEFTLPENAARYYKKAKTIKTDIEVKKKMLPAAKQKAEKAIALLNQFDAIDNLKDLKKFEAENFKNKGNNSMKELDESPEAKFRRFDLGDGYSLYVGKNASNNDELTVRFAKPNDIWMHARGCPGSHTVIKSPNPKEVKPPKQILTLAARITAYYSKQKNAKYVPVAYTQKKNVFKPRGAAPGAVVMNREEVIMAEPKLPEGEVE